ncbi:hypothetical protein RFI_22051 [Reticulomyxa filosa]|uniref:Uncharacterized protein n=1 Tax=Reticulomyxa filosa TaxID=46433 RepID=X6MMT0_RETFI|nr:hypothetical protein RFI_22051 [Reticulomyxa filosa]|eukprot:ETO15313.1 hypothetical protein RFI_22051 [Reticulomyxa filosa]
MQLNDNEKIHRNIKKFSDDYALYRKWKSNRHKKIDCKELKISSDVATKYPHLDEEFLIDLDCVNTNHQQFNAIAKRKVTSFEKWTKLKIVYPNFWKVAEGMSEWNAKSFFSKINRLRGIEVNDKLQSTLTQHWFKPIAEQKNNSEEPSKKMQKRKRKDSSDDDIHEIIPTKKIRLDKDELILDEEKPVEKNTAEEITIDKSNASKIYEILELLQSIDRKIDGLEKRVTNIENQLQKK